MPVVAHRRCVATLAITLMAGMCVAASVLAQEPPSDLTRPAQGPQVRVSTQERSLSDAVRHVQRTTGGRILGAERVPYDGRDINRVKYMDDRGRVRYMDDPGPSQRGREPRTPDPAPRRANP